MYRAKYGSSFTFFISVILHDRSAWGLSILIHIGQFLSSYCLNYRDFIIYSDNW